MSEPTELTKHNIQDIRNGLGAKAFLVTAPRLTLMVEVDGEKTAYSIGDSIDLEQFEEKPEQEEVEPQDMSHRVKVYCDGLNHNVHAVRLNHDNMSMVREWCKEDVLRNAYIGDWVIKHNGHFGIMSDDAFCASYKLWKPGKSFNDFNDILNGTYERIGINGRSFA